MGEGTAEPNAVGWLPTSGVTVPQLDTVQFARLTAYAVPELVSTGDVVFGPGDVDYDLIVIESGRIDIITPASRDDPEEVVATYGAGGFLGELNFLTGQTAYLTGRVAETGRIHRISRERFRQVMAQDPEVSDILVRTFLTRRDLLRGGAAARSIAILGGGSSGEALALRTFAARQRLPHLWWDADSDDGRAMIHSARLTPADLPAIFTPHRVLRRATPGELAHLLGLSYQRDTHDLVDLTVIGSGPAGLGAAVYGASEGLDTVLLDAIGIGGQAAASSRIENYLGFPSGLSGQDLTQRAALQAMKFGAQLSSPCVVVDLDTSGAHLRVTLGDGHSITARTVLIASGVHYRALPLPRWNEFEGAGIYYAATAIEARACGEQPVTVVGGANSAGQAALYLASRGSPVTLAVRGHDPSATMSSYLLGRLAVDPRITIRTTTEVTDLHGTTALESITLSDNTSGRSAPQPCYGLFCFIGAEPATSWLRDVDLDADGFIRTDTQLDPDTLGATWAALGRAPLPFETSMPGVFAAGDVRLASVKRVASAVGEGASAVRSIHAAIGVRA